MLEGEKQQRIADARRRQEEEAKVNLMREVYESRATHVEHMKRTINNNKDMVRWDMNDLQVSLEQQNKMAEEKRVAA